MSIEATTLILLSDDSVKNISNVNVGDRVITRFGPKVVLRVFDDGEQPVITFYTEDSSVTCTLDHGWLSAAGKEPADWHTAEDLIIGDRLFLFPEEYAAAEQASIIKSIVRGESQQVYNIETEFTEEYVANGFISHNTRRF